MVSQTKTTRQRKDFRAKFSIAKDEERSVVARISTIDVDRDGDVLLPMGANLSEFRKNPVVLFAHNGGSLPVGQAVSIKRESRGIRAKVRFADRPDSHPPEQEWVPDTIFSLFQQGVLRAFSVGFIADEIREADAKDIGRFGDDVRTVIAKWRLLEFSVVPVPANQNALVEAVSKGLLEGCPYVVDKWHLRPNNDEKHLEMDPDAMASPSLATLEFGCEPELTIE